MSQALGWVTVIGQEGAPRTVRYDTFVSLLFKVDSLAMMKCHAAMGVAGEAGELLDAIKKEVHYNKPLDRDNLIEELGDIRFYIQAVMNLYNVSEAELLQANANKLAKRYVDLAYSDMAAIMRADKPRKD